MDDRDWGRIKAEYISGLSSYRELAEKYGIGRSVLTKRGTAEKWVEARSQYRDKTVSKTVERIGDRQAERAARVQTVADKLLAKLEAAVDAVTGEDLASNPKLPRGLSGAIKDIKDIMDIRPDADCREQEARIEKLRKEIEGDKVDNGITLVIEGGEEAWKT